MSPKRKETPVVSAIGHFMRATRENIIVQFIWNA